MIFVDASALTAVIGAEPMSDRVLDCLESDSIFFTSPVAVYETAVAVARSANYSIAEALTEVRDFLARAGIMIEAVDDAQAAEALAAFSRFGKGRHPAGLNMGDCFAYASAKTRDAAILFVGNDFSRTDLRDALANP
ncbi:type II toxin-antitoxin system VapC family toxin [Bosea sp. 124]|uniref:type II toxin-antitoxin system VapC family toxin n=1 Tax=Bosea sp. 124 TaxID=2135642 RepID=UPI000D447172|nr:type II toxin-antitoxin system VapC family toxin [Bosea sp. 124]PTM39355.1 ribonuclease VapC [Bosea sp. 124]